MPHVDTPQSVCRLGVARCDVTPPVGIYHRMWGAATHDRSTGVHRPLTATALVFRADSRSVGPITEQVFVSLDHCLLWAHEMEALIAAVCGPATAPVDQRLEIQQLAIAFSHTHGAGLMGLERIGLPGGDLIPAYLEEMAQRVRGIVVEAHGA